MFVLVMQSGVPIDRDEKKESLHLMHIMHVSNNLFL